MLWGRFFSMINIVRSFATFDRRNSELDIKMHEQFQSKTEHTTPYSIETNA